MPITYKVLGQSNPSAATATTLYTTPSATSTVVSTITVANLTGTAASFRVSVRIAGAAPANNQFIAYDVVVGASDTTTLTLGITLAATDLLVVFASTATLTFSAFGSEIS